MMRFFDTIILGSGYFSIGYALSIENTLIIERTQLADPTFGGTLSGFIFDESKEWENETKKLHLFYLEHKIANEKHLNSSVSEVGLSAYISKRKVQILLGSECININKSDGGYELTVFNNGGYSQIFAKKLIDARRADEKKYLNVLCRGEIDAAALSEQKNFKFSVTGAFQSEESVVGFVFSDSKNVNFAKAEAIRYLEKQFAACGAQIVQCAYLMHADPTLCSFEKGEIPRVRDISFGDVFSAFDAGIKYGKENVK